MAGDAILLFSYGTLQQDDVQQALFGRRLSGRTDALPGYRRDWLTISDPDVVAASGAAMHPVVTQSGDPADSVEGTVFTLTAEDLAAADVYEAADYRRVMVTLTSGTQAWLYVKA